MIDCTNGCGKKLKNKRALFAHTRFHCTNREEKDKATTTTEHTCEFRLLRSDVEREAKVKSLGYTKICDDCDEVL